MHPAKSVIAFTTLSGAGYGLLFIVIIGQFTGLYTASFNIQIVSLLIAFVLVSSGLLISTLHLGHPERAWRALSQWRSSWLSREGVCSLLTFIPWLCYAIASFTIDNNNKIIFWSGIITAVLSVLTVFTTSMIYRSLKPVQSWYNVYVTPVYLIFSLASGLTLLNTILYLSHYPSLQINKLTLLTLTAALLLKRGYWRYIDKSQRRSTIESATGLGKFGKVQVLEHPHDQQNYLMAEMGFQIARKHSKKLRSIFHISFTAAIISLAIAWFYMGMLDALMASIACLMMIVGTAIERWLFFAEAKHDQALYYGG